MLFTKIGRRGQITIPKAVRQKTGLKEGDRVVFIVDGERVLIKLVTQTFLDLRGSVPVSGKQDFDAIRRQVITTGFLIGSL